MTKAYANTIICVHTYIQIPEPKKFKLLKTLGLAKMLPKGKKTL